MSDDPLEIIENLQAFQGRLLDAIENLAGAFVLWDAEDRLEVFNSRAKDLYGQHEDIMVKGRTFEQIIRKAVETKAISIPKADQEAWVKERVDHHRNVSEVMTRRYPDGRWVRITEHRTPDGGTVGIGVDITELKKREIALDKSREEAELANKAKTRFLAAASHDLRQPLHAMGLFISSLAKNVEGTSNQDLVTNLQASLDGMNKLFNALLDISQLEAETLKPRFEVFPVNNILEKMKTRFTLPAKEKGLELTIVPSSLHIRSDQAMLDRIVSNFVANAVRYTESGRILVGCRNLGKSLRIEVMDTGQGIPKGQMKDIFKEFHQVDNPERDRRQGLGLGLAIAERLAQLLKHRLGAVSQHGFGSRFSIEAPVMKPRELTPAIIASNQPSKDSLSGYLVAVIDDDKEVLAGMQAMLSDLKCEIATGENPQQVIANLPDTNRAPDIVIADYRLRAGATGSEAIAELRKALNKDIPGIIVTGDTAPERLKEARSSGFKLLHKPVHPANLTSIIRFILKN